MHRSIASSSRIRGTEKQANGCMAHSSVYWRVKCQLGTNAWHRKIDANSSLAPRQRIFACQSESPRFNLRLLDYLGKTINVACRCHLLIDSATSYCFFIPSTQCFISMWVRELPRLLPFFSLQTGVADRCFFLPRTLIPPLSSVGRHH